MSLDISLQQFLHEIVLPRIPAKGPLLEVGCGSYPVLSTIKDSIKNERYCLDIISQTGFENLSFIQANILDLAVELPSSLACWFDAHLFHTLTSSADRERYFAQVKKHLDPYKGLFALEMGVASKTTSVWKNLYLRDDEPFRFCPNALEMEHILLNEGLQIEYFRIDSGSRFIFDADRDVVMDADPLRLRALCRLN
jgi:hypothetical protein